MAADAKKRQRAQRVLLQLKARRAAEAAKRAAEEEAERLEVLGGAALEVQTWYRGRSRHRGMQQLLSVVTELQAGVRGQAGRAAAGIARAAAAAAAARAEEEAREKAEVEAAKAKAEEEAAVADAKAIAEAKAAVEAAEATAAVKAAEDEAAAAAAEAERQSTEADREFVYGKRAGAAVRSHPGCCTCLHGHPNCSMLSHPGWTGCRSMRTRRQAKRRPL